MEFHPSIQVHDRRCEAGSVRDVTLTRAEKLNALSAAMMEALVHALDDASASGASLVVLRAQGQRVFCAGADLDEIRAGGAALAAWERAFETLAVAVETCPVPVLCCVHGHVFGGGIVLAGLCDVVVARDDTSFRFEEMQLGLYPAMLHAALSGRVASNTLYQFCAGARHLAPGDALQAGLITEISGEFDLRVAYYAARTGALMLGRTLRNGGRPDARARMSAVAASAAEHFRSEQVNRLLAKPHH